MIICNWILSKRNKANLEERLGILQARKAAGQVGYHLGEADYNGYSTISKSIYRFFSPPDDNELKQCSTNWDSAMQMTMQNQINENVQKISTGLTFLTNSMYVYFIYNFILEHSNIVIVEIKEITSNM